MNKIKGAVRVSVRAARRVLAVARAVLPGWALPVLGVCLLIPGPFDEIAVLVIVGVLVAVSPVRRSKAAAAWRDDAR